MRATRKENPMTKAHAPSAVWASPTPLFDSRRWIKFIRHSPIFSGNRRPFLGGSRIGGDLPQTLSELASLIRSEVVSHS